MEQQRKSGPWWLLITWSVLTGLTLLEMSTPLRFSSVALRSWVHCLAWVLALGVAWKASNPVVRGMAWVQVGAVAVVPILLAGVYAFSIWGEFFFKETDTNYDEYYKHVDFALIENGRQRIYFRHIYSSDPVAYNPENYNQLVVVQTLLPGLRWQSPLADDTRLSPAWTVLDSAALEAFLPVTRLNRLLPGGWKYRPPRPLPASPTTEAAPPPLAPPPPTLGGSDERVYTYVEHMPALPGGGGQQAISEAIRRQIAWPNEQLKPLVVSFVVGPTGELSDVWAARGVSAQVDAAAVAAVCQLPPFTPGKQNGQLVPVRYMLAIARATRP